LGHLGHPARLATDVPSGLTVVRDLDDSAVSILEGGGKVLWLFPPDRVVPDPKQGVALGFDIFWNTAWTDAGRLTRSDPVRSQAPLSLLSHRRSQQLAVVFDHLRRGHDPR
jgi:hypothetical protein